MGPGHRRVLALLIVALAAGFQLQAGEADVRLISQGREVNLEEHLVPGKLVIFDFYADWCAPCRVLTPRLEKLVAQNPDRIALRKVDVINWESPVSRQHGVSSLPHLVLFGADGGRLAAGGSDRVLRVLARELGGGGEGVADHRGVGGIPWSALIILAVAIVVGSLFLRSRVRPEAETDPGSEPATAAVIEDHGPKIWFVMVDGALDGPFSASQLEERVRSGDFSSELRARRRGETTWLPVGEGLKRG